MYFQTVRDRVFVALDVSSADDARRIVETLGDEASSYKIGTELFCNTGPEIVRELAESGKNIFLDLKFHDIPNTVAAAVRSVATLGARIINVHCLGGVDMMHAAHIAAVESETDIKVVGVTILTSMDNEDLNEIGISIRTEYQVLLLARLAHKASLNGVVCSPQEIKILRNELGNDFMLITPGIRPSWSELNDQKRIMTPQEAISTGASALVIGRPITGAKQPADAMRAILDEF